MLVGDPREDLARVSEHCSVRELHRRQLRLACRLLELLA